MIRANTKICTINTITYSRKGLRQLLYSNIREINHTIVNTNETTQTKPKINQFKSINTQHEFIESLIHKLGFHSLEDLLKLKKKKVIEFGGKDLLLLYSSDKLNLLMTLYPNYPWPKSLLSNNLKTKIGSFKIFDNQVLFMDRLYKKLKLKSFEGWKSVTKKTISTYGGTSLVTYTYKRNLEKLFSTIYPNYPWDKTKAPKLNSMEYFERLENQQLFFHKLFEKLQLINLEEFTKLSSFEISSYGGKELMKLYRKDPRKYLPVVFPNYPWNFSHYRSPKSKKLQLKLMQQIYEKLGLQSIDDWGRVSNKEIIQHGGAGLLVKYSNNLSKLLTDIYPDHKWNQVSRNKYFKSMTNQRSFMDELFFTLQLNTFDDWLHVSHSQIINNGGRSLLSTYYDNNLIKVLKAVYPNFPWHKNQNQLSDHALLFLTQLKDIESQRKFINNLKSTLKLQSIEEFLDLPSFKLKKFKVDLFLQHYYSNNMKKMLLTLFPKHRWGFDDFSIQRRNFKTIELQSQFMEYLFHKLHFKSLDDWIRVPSNLFSTYGGKMLVSGYYENDMSKLLKGIYPNYPWVFDRLSHMEIVERHRKSMKKIYKRLKLTSLEDWKYVRKTKLATYTGFRDLIDYYGNDMRQLLISIYPDYNWDFSDIKYRPHGKFSKSREFISEKLRRICVKFRIRKKNDWYRLSNRLEEISLYKALRFIYPKEEWIQSEFLLRSKKVNQRVLCITVNEIYENFYWVENYRSPLLQSDKDRSLEFDIYLPALNLVFEYQGEQHYDDLPGAYGHFEIYQRLDILKAYLTENLKITLIPVPYWWDQSPSSLLSTIASTFRHHHHHHIK